MLNTEFGGMNEIFADLYADTGDKRWLDLSYKFEHRSFIEPLKRHQDNLGGKHGNTQVPKLIGSADRFAYTGDAGDVIAASFFWDRVVQHHSFATGGHGKDEYFGRADKLSDRVDGRTAETCNVYNMLKLTRRLFALRPDAHYADFHERALFNHILASIDPKDGRTCYMVPVGRGVQHEYQDMLRSFTCCVGSGMESHALHGDGIYYEVGRQALGQPLRPLDRRVDRDGRQAGDGHRFPRRRIGEAHADARIAEGIHAGPAPARTGSATASRSRSTARPCRRTEIAGRSGISASRQIAQSREPRNFRRRSGSYVELKRTWKTGDTVEVDLAQDAAPGAAAGQSASRRHPVGSAGAGRRPGPGGRARTRPRRRAEPPKVPVFVAAERPVAEWLKPVAGKPGQFRTDGVGTRARRGLRALLPPAPAHLRRVLGPVHARRMGEEGRRAPAQAGRGRPRPSADSQAGG